jgi:aminodeoxyfutalosine deaminase
VLKCKRLKAGGKFTIYQPIILYRKFTADHIFTGREILFEPAVLITDEAGAIIEIVDNKDAGDGIESFSGLLTPGFTNAHCHLELSHLKGIIPEKTGLVEFAQQVMGNRASSGELKLDAMVNAEAEMHKNGIVAVGDICNTTDSIAVKRQSKLRWHNFIEVSGFTEASAEIRLDNMKKVYEQFQTINGEQKTTFSPHAPYSVSKKLFQLLNDETAGQLITIHNQECAAENDLYKYKGGGFLALYKNFGIDISSFEPTGRTSFQSWLPCFNNCQSIISVHNTFTSEADFAFQGSLPPDISCQVFYCLCINANKYIEQKIPPISLLTKGHDNIVIGTDSYASNLQLNILEEIKTIQLETNNAIPLPELLQWATINGAKALQLDHIAGSFEKGKKPGIVLIEGLDNLQTTPRSIARRIL